MGKGAGKSGAGKKDEDGEDKKAVDFSDALSTDSDLFSGFSLIKKVDSLGYWKSKEPMTGSNLGKLPLYSISCSYRNVLKSGQVCLQFHVFGNPMKPALYVLTGSV